MTGQGHPWAKAVLVGGPDVDARLGFMHCLSPAVTVSAMGSRPGLRAKFAAEGFGYHSYQLSRQVNPVQDLITVGQLLVLFRHLRPQIVHTFDTKPGVWGCVAARLAGVPVIIATLTGLGTLYVGDGLWTRFVRSIYEMLQRLACRLCDLVVFQNRDDALEFISKKIVAAEKTALIPGSGVSTSAFDPARVTAAERANVRADLGIGPGEVVVTMISRLIRSKGVLDFVSAAERVRRCHPQAHFVLVGPEDHDSIDPLSEAELVELRKAVTWSGPRGDIPVVLAASDVFVLPSDREGLSRVLLEAASMELPIVTTDVPGCRDIVEHGANGFLVPPRNPTALSQAIERLVEDPQLRQRFGRVSRERVVHHFDLGVVGERTRLIYRDLLERKTLLPGDAPM